MQTDHVPAEARPSLFRNPYLWAFFIGIISITAIRPLLIREPGPPPVIGQVPAFTLIDQQGDEFGSADLSGQVYVANFFFTNCPSICPRLMERMAKLQRRYSENGIDQIRLVSISVDPETDVPERLREYAASFNVDPARWHLLTGHPSEIRELLNDGFRVAMGSPESPGGGPYDIAHSGKLVIVDQDGGIRGYYDSDELGLDEIFHRSQHVLKE